MPNLACVLDSANKNKELWDAHQETEEEKLVYEKEENPNSSSESDEENKDNMLASLAEEDVENDWKSILTKISFKLLYF